jgi:hypothetical protein
VGDRRIITVETGVALAFCALLFMFLAAVRLVASTRYAIESLDIAAARGDLSMMRLWLYAGTDPNGVVEEKSMCGNDPRDIVGFHHPLHSAAWEGSPEAVRLLLEHGADPNAVGSHGRTPLWFSALGGRPDNARLLLSSGAWVAGGGKDFSNSPLLIAAEGGETEVIRLLLENGAGVGEEFDLALEKAIDYDNPEAASLLKSARPHLDIPVGVRLGSN